MTKKDSNKLIMKFNQRLRRSGISVEDRKAILNNIDGVVYSEASGLISRATELDDKMAETLNQQIETKSKWGLTDDSAKAILEATKDEFYAEFEHLTPGQRKAARYDEKHEILSSYMKKMRNKDYAGAKQERHRVLNIINAKKSKTSTVSGFESSDPLNEY